MAVRRLDPEILRPPDPYEPTPSPYGWQPSYHGDEPIWDVISEGLDKKNKKKLAKKQPTQQKKEEPDPRSWWEKLYKPDPREVKKNISKIKEGMQKDLQVGIDPQKALQYRYATPTDFTPDKVGIGIKYGKLVVEGDKIYRTREFNGNVEPEILPIAVINNKGNIQVFQYNGVDRNKFDQYTSKSRTELAKNWKSDAFEAFNQGLEKSVLAPLTTVNNIFGDKSIRYEATHAPFITHAKSKQYEDYRTAGEIAGEIGKAVVPLSVAGKFKLGAQMLDKAWKVGFATSAIQEVPQLAKTLHDDEMQPFGAVMSSALNTAANIAGVKSGMKAAEAMHKAIDAGNRIRGVAKTVGKEVARQTAIAAMPTAHSQFSAMASKQQFAKEMNKQGFDYEAYNDFLKEYLANMGTVGAVNIITELMGIGGAYRAKQAKETGKPLRNVVSRFFAPGAERVDDFATLSTHRLGGDIPTKEWIDKTITEAKQGDVIRKPKDEQRLRKILELQKQKMGGDAEDHLINHFNDSKDNVFTSQDVETAIKDAYEKGIIKSPEDEKSLYTLYRRHISNPEETYNYIENLIKRGYTKEDILNLYDQKYTAESGTKNKKILGFINPELLTATKAKKNEMRQATRDAVERIYHQIEENIAGQVKTSEAPTTQPTEQANDAMPETQQSTDVVKSATVPDRKLTLEDLDEFYNTYANQYRDARIDQHLDQRVSNARNKANTILNLYYKITGEQPFGKSYSEIIDRVGKHLNGEEPSQTITKDPGLNILDAKQQGDVVSELAGLGDMQYVVKNMLDELDEQSLQRGVVYSDSQYNAKLSKILGSKSSVDFANMGSNTERAKAIATQLNGKITYGELVDKLTNEFGLMINKDDLHRRLGVVEDPALKGATKGEPIGEETATEQLNNLPSNTTQETKTATASKRTKKTDRLSKKSQEITTVEQTAKALPAPEETKQDDPNVIAVEDAFMKAKIKQLVKQKDIKNIDPETAKMVSSHPEVAYVFMSKTKQIESAKDVVAQLAKDEFINLENAIKNGEITDPNTQKIVNDIRFYAKNDDRLQDTFRKYLDGNRRLSKTIKGKIETLLNNELSNVKESYHQAINDLYDDTADLIHKHLTGKIIDDIKADETSTQTVDSEQQQLSTNENVSAINEQNNLDATTEPQTSQSVAESPAVKELPPTETVPEGEIKKKEYGESQKSDTQEGAISNQEEAVNTGHSAIKGIEPIASQQQPPAVIEEPTTAGATDKIEPPSENITSTPKPENKMERIRVEITESGLPALWEAVGGTTNAGEARIIRDQNGRPKKPVYVKRSGHLSNGNHALIPVEVGDIIVESYRNMPDFKIHQVYRIVNFDGEYAVAELLYEFRDGQWNFYPPAYLQPAITAALEKAKEGIAIRQQTDANAQQPKQAIQQTEVTANEQETPSITPEHETEMQNASALIDNVSNTINEIDNLLKDNGIDFSEATTKPKKRKSKTETNEEQVEAPQQSRRGNQGKERVSKEQFDLEAEVNKLNSEILQLEDAMSKTKDSKHSKQLRKQIFDKKERIRFLKQQLKSKGYNSSAQIKENVINKLDDWISRNERYEDDYVSVWKDGDKLKVTFKTTVKSPQLSNFANTFGLNDKELSKVFFGVSKDKAITRGLTATFAVPQSNAIKASLKSFSDEIAGIGLLMYSGNQQNDDEEIKEGNILSTLAAVAGTALVMRGAARYAQTKPNSKIAKLMERLGVSKMFIDQPIPNDKVFERYKADMLRKAENPSEQQKLINKYNQYEVAGKDTEESTISLFRSLNHIQSDAEPVIELKSAFYNGKTKANEALQQIRNAQDSYTSALDHFYRLYAEKVGDKSKSELQEILIKTNDDVFSEAINIKKNLNPEESRIRLSELNTSEYLKNKLKANGIADSMLDDAIVVYRQQRDVIEAITQHQANANLLQKYGYTFEESEQITEKINQELSAVQLEANDIRAQIADRIEAIKQTETYQKLIDTKNKTSGRILRDLRAAEKILSNDKELAVLNARLSITKKKLDNFKNELSAIDEHTKFVSMSSRMHYMPERWTYQRSKGDYGLSIYMIDSNGKRLSSYDDKVNLFKFFKDTKERNTYLNDWLEKHNAKPLDSPDYPNVWEIEYTDVDGNKIKGRVKVKEDLNVRTIEMLVAQTTSAMRRRFFALLRKTADYNINKKELIEELSKLKSEIPADESVPSSEFDEGTTKTINDTIEALEKLNTQNIDSQVLEDIFAYVLKPKSKSLIETKNTRGYKDEDDRWIDLWDAGIQRMVNRISAQYANGSLKNAVEKQILETKTLGINNTYTEFLDGLHGDLLYSPASKSFADKVLSPKFKRAWQVTESIMTAGALGWNTLSGIKNKLGGFTTASIQLVRKFGINNLPKIVKSMVTAPRGELKFLRNIQSDNIYGNILDDIRKRIIKEGIPETTAVKSLDDEYSNLMGKVSKVKDKLYALMRLTEISNRYETAMSFAQVYVDTNPFEKSGLTKDEYISQVVKKAAIFVGETQGMFDFIYRTPVEKFVIKEVPFLGRSFLTLVSPTINHLALVSNMYKHAIKASDNTAKRNAVAGVLSQVVVASMLGGVEFVVGLCDALKVNDILSGGDEKTIDKLDGDLRKALYDAGFGNETIDKIVKSARYGIKSALLDVDLHMDISAYELLTPFMMRVIAETFATDIPNILENGADGLLDVLSKRFVALGRAVKAGRQYAVGMTMDKKGNPTGEEYDFGTMVKEGLFGESLHNRYSRLASNSANLAYLNSGGKRKFVNELLSGANKQEYESSDIDEAITEILQDEKLIDDFYYKYNNVIKSDDVKEAIDHNKDLLDNFIKSNLKEIYGLMTRDDTGVTGAKAFARKKASLYNYIEDYILSSKRTELANEMFNRAGFDVEFPSKVEDYDQLDLSEYLPDGTMLMNYPEQDRPFYYALYKLYSKQKKEEE